MTNLFLKSRKGVTGIVTAAISLVVLVIVITSVVMPTLKTANTTGFTAQELAIWNTLGIFVVLGVLVAIAVGFLAGRLR